MWAHDGTTRPDFAATPGAGQESVWDYPRPPRIQADSRHVLVRSHSHVIADTRRAVRVLETASPPTFYLPPDDVDRTLLRPTDGESYCEWKGHAAYRDIILPDHTVVNCAAWSYPRPKPAFAAIAGWFAFYPSRVQCEVAGKRVRPQAGGFYGGWVTDDIVGPMKGDPGTAGW